MVFQFAYFVEFTKGSQPAKFQWCRFSGSNFTEGLQKHNDDVIMMTSFFIFLGFEISIFVKLVKTINLPSFKSFSYLNQILQRLV